MSYLAVLFIKLYQKMISPILPDSCRFYPSCSHYSIDAFKVHGFVYGGYLTIRRVLRCNPYCKFGYDPVPEKKSCTYNLTNK